MLDDEGYNRLGENHVLRYLADRHWNVDEAMAKIIRGENWRRDNDC